MRGQMTSHYLDRTTPTPVRDTGKSPSQKHRCGQTWQANNQKKEGDE